MLVSRMAGLLLGLWRVLMIRFFEGYFGGSSPCPGLKRSVGKELEELLRT